MSCAITTTCLACTAPLVIQYKINVLLTKNGVDAVVLALDNELCHDHHVLGVHRPVSDPVLLRQRARGVHDEFCNSNKPNF